MAFDFPLITTQHGSRQPALLIVMSILLAISLTTVTLRLFCRVARVHFAGLDDYLIVGALCVAIALGIMNGFHITYGTGLHVADLPADPDLALIPTLKFWYAYQIVYPLALAFVKASLLASYWRIFSKTTVLRASILTVAGVVGIYTIVVMFVNAFECRHIPDAWKITFPKGCNDLSASYFSMASINIVTDLVILILPIRPLWQLKINRRAKYALVGTFLIGSMAVIASILRLQALYLYMTTDDVSYDAIFILIWSQVEINVAITCASVPSLRPLFSNAFNSSRNYNSAPDYRQGPYGTGASERGRVQSHGGAPIEMYPTSKRDSRNAKHAMSSAQPDNDSEELILDKSSGHITRTVETSILSEPMQDSAMSNRPMTRAKW